MSLFGRVNTPASSAPATGGLFGGATAGAPAAPSGGLFGAAAPAASTAPASGGLFGTTTTTTPATSAAPASGGLFGAKPATTGTTGGLFGNTNPTATGAATSSAPTGGLFGGGAAATTTTSAPAAGGLFGNTTATTSAPATGGLFGNTTATTSAPATGGLFGNATATTSAPAAGGLFGAANTTTTSAPAAGGLFGTANSITTTAPAAGGLFGGASTTNTANTVPAATVDITRLTPTTRFNDLHPSLQTELQNLEQAIQSHIQLSTSLTDRFPAHRTALTTIPQDASILSHRLSTTKLIQSSDNAAIQQIQALHAQDDAASTLSIRTLDLFRLPHAQRSQYIARTTDRESGADVTSNKPMLKYFNEQTSQMEKKLDVVVRSVREVEESLRSVEVQAAQGAQGAGVMGRDMAAVTGGIGGRQDARRLNRTLREFNEALKDVSGRILDARDGLGMLEGR